MDRGSHKSGWRGRALAFGSLGLMFLALASGVDAQTNLALNKPVTASANPQFPPAEAVDGNAGTRWASAAALDPQWIFVDLGATTSIGKVVLTWETASAKSYQIQTSADAATWTNIYTTTTGPGGTETLNISGSGRYVRMYGTVRNTGYGYSLWEIAIYAPTGTATATARATATSTPRPTATSTSTATATARATATATTRATATSTTAATATATTRPTATPTTAAGTNLALNRPCTASSAPQPCANAFDSNTTGTRWESTQGVDPQWVFVDLGSSTSINKVVLTWETAAGKSYQIQTSADAATWTSIYTTTTGAGGTETLNITGTGRYVRMYGTLRTTQYGYSLWDFAVYGGAGATATATTRATATATVAATSTPTATSAPRATATPTPGGAVNFGPNVAIFDPGMSAASIQSTIDSVFAVQHTNQFGLQRNALLFKPGTYNGIQVNVGFYTGVQGLGLNPDDVLINGNIDVRADWMGDPSGHCCNATVNFWRAMENISTAPAPSDGTGWAHWAVSQAAPFRRVHVKGSYFLWDGGWASGGYMADTLIDGWLEPGSQQQWYTRNSNLAHGWGGGVWNMVFQGVVNAPSDATFPSVPYTTVANTPSLREKPFLYLNAAGQYNVFVPSLRSNTTGTSWPNAAGTSIPITNFLIVRSDNFSVATINSALAGGQHILFTPGIYHVTSTINVTQPNTVILGLGMATLSCDSGVNCINVADVDGVKIGHLLFEAGSASSASLLEIGPAGSSLSHSANPTSVHDVFFRIGGVQQGQCQNALTINSNDALVDHTWAWRADHGTGVGWNVNVGVNGVVVNGANVKVYGVFSEHFEKYDVLWNGNNGSCYYLQNEMAYDVPNQASWMDGSSLGFSAYKVAPTVTNHQAFGVGSYCLFNVDPTVHAAHGFETPSGAGIHFYHLATISLGNGTIDHIINNVGDPAVASAVTPHYWTNYP
jgi:hypothetical protein